MHYKANFFETVLVKSHKNVFVSHFFIVILNMSMSIFQSSVDTDLEFTRAWC